MALIDCRECGKEISDKARTCPHCGCPSEEQERNQKIRDTNTQSAWVVRIIVGILIIILGFFVALGTYNNIG